jgi:hypothetical protein
LDYLEANRRQLICVNRLISVTDILPYFTQLYCLIYIYMMETLYSRCVVFPISRYFWGTRICILLLV